MYSVILAAVDGSDRSRSVLNAALGVAERFDGHVHLFRAVSVPPEFPAAAAMPPDSLPALLAQEARRSLVALAADNPRVRIEEPDLTTPQPWRAILDAAAKIRADLIVVGSHGYGGWDHLLGTNASKVADRADRSVLVVHERRET
jgi:nucleotide-binding universal stress UspA family protein